MAVIVTRYGFKSVRDEPIRTTRRSGRGGGSSSTRGTYYTGSRTYIDSSGAGFSMRMAPSGARIVSGIDPNLQRKQEAIKKAAIEKARQEAERKAREEIAKAIRIKDRQQRERLLKQIERVKRGKIQAAKVREMTAIQKQQFFRRQAEVQKRVEILSPVKRSIS